MNSANNLFSRIYHEVEARYTNAKEIPSELCAAVGLLRDITIGAIAAPVAAYRGKIYKLEMAEQSRFVLPLIFTAFMKVLNPQFVNNSKQADLDLGSYTQGFVSSYVVKKLGLDSYKLNKIQHACAIPVSVIVGIFDAVIAVPAVALTTLTVGSIPTLDAFTFIQLKFLGEIGEITYHFCEILK